MKKKYFILFFLVCIFILIFISLQGIVYGLFLDDFFSEPGTPSPIPIDNINVNITTTNSEYHSFSQNISEFFTLLTGSDPDFQKFSDLEELMPFSQMINVISDNYSTIEKSDFNTKINNFIPVKWENLNLDWFYGVEPRGEIEVYSSPDSPSQKYIKINPVTYEKGLLLYSSMNIQPENPKIFFTFQGSITDQDALLFLAGETNQPKHKKWYVVPPGTYLDMMEIDLSEFSNTSVALILGAYYTSEQANPWVLNNFSRGLSETIPGKLTFQHNIQEPESIEILPVPNENVNPINISMVWPSAIRNTEQEYSIQIFGNGFLENVQAVLISSAGDKIPFKETIYHSPGNITAIFSNTNIKSGTYGIAVMNPDGKSASMESALTIFTPDRPIIQGIWPNSGPNTGMVNISELMVSNYSTGDQIFLSREGHKPIYATRAKIGSSGIISCFFDLTGEPVGVWNLTVQKDNGRNDVCIDCFTITGPNDQFYSFVNGWQITSDDGISPDIEAVTTDISDNLIVTDSAHDMVLKYSPDGQLLQEWGRHGNGTGEFIDPADIAVSSSGSVYVVDKGNGRVQKFTSEGNFETMFGEKGSLEGQFSNPSGIAIDQMNNIFVSDTHNHRIQKFDPNGVFIKSIGTQGGIEGQFNYPTDLVMNYENNLYIIDNGNDRIQKLNTTGEFITQWGSPGFESGQFLSPGSIATDSMSNVFVTDLTNHQVQKFNSTGAFLTKWGSEGSENGQFQCPNAIVVNNTDYIYVIDCTDNRVQIFKMTEDSQFFTPYQEETFEQISDNYSDIPYLEPSFEPTTEITIEPSLDTDDNMNFNKDNKNIF